MERREANQAPLEGDMQDGVDVILPPDPHAMECLDTRVFDVDPYNQAVTADWLQLDPAEDRQIFSPQASRVDPSS